MKRLTQLLAMTLLVASAESVFAEGHWVFNVEIGSTRGECNSGYAGSTADALGCSAIAPSERKWTRNNTDSPKFEVLSATPGSTGASSGQIPPTESNAEKFWVPEDGKVLNYSQVVVSAMIERQKQQLIDEPAIVLAAKLPD